MGWECVDLPLKKPQNCEVAIFFQIHLPQRLIRGCKTSLPRGLSLGSFRFWNCTICRAERTYRMFLASLLDATSLPNSKPRIQKFKLLLSCPASSEPKKLLRLQQLERFGCLFLEIAPQDGATGKCGFPTLKPPPNQHPEKRTVTRMLGLVVPNHPFTRVRASPFYSVGFRVAP